MSLELTRFTDPSHVRLTSSSTSGLGLGSDTFARLMERFGCFRYFSAIEGLGSTVNAFMQPNRPQKSLTSLCVGCPKNLLVLKTYYLLTTFIITGYCICSCVVALNFSGCISSLVFHFLFSWLSLPDWARSPDENLGNIRVGSTG